jgi:hypothetical protein
LQTNAFFYYSEKRIGLGAVVILATQEAEIRRVAI